MHSLLPLTVSLLANASTDVGAVRSTDDSGAVYAPLPEQPHAAVWGERIRVVCHMVLAITPEGTVQRSVASGCEGDFRRRAVETTRTWTFEPVLDSNGQPRSTRYAFDLTYRRLDRPVRDAAEQGPVAMALPALPSVLEWALDLELSCRTIVHVAASGEVDEVEVEGCGALLVSQIQSAMLSWRFDPITGDDGQPVASLYPVTVTFRSANLTDEALTVDVPGLLTIPLRPGPTADLPPAPAGVVHRDEPLPVDKRLSGSIPSIDKSLRAAIKQLGLGYARFHTIALLTVNKKGKVTDFVYLDGPPELEQLTRALCQQTRFDRGGLTVSESVRFVYELPIRVEL